MMRKAKRSHEDDVALGEEAGNSEIKIKDEDNKEDSANKKLRLEDQPTSTSSDGGPVSSSGIEDNKKALEIDEDGEEDDEDDDDDDDADDGGKDDAEDTNQPGKLYCFECKRQFQTKRQFNRHQTKKHMKNAKFYCMNCGERFRTKKQLKNHLYKKNGVHQTSNNTECPRCDDRFRDENNLSRHLKTVHADDKPYLCVLCGDTYNNPGGLRAHTLTHMQKKQKYIREFYQLQKEKRNLHDKGAYY